MFLPRNPYESARKPVYSCPEARIFLPRGSNGRPNPAQMHVSWGVNLPRGTYQNGSLGRLWGGRKADGTTDYPVETLYLHRVRTNPAQKHVLFAGRTTK